MATDEQLQRKLNCHHFPDFAATCLFIEQFGDALGLLPLNVKNLREGFEDASEGQLINYCHFGVFFQFYLKFLVESFI